MRYDENLMHSRFYAPGYLHVLYFFRLKYGGGIVLFFFKKKSITSNILTFGARRISGDFIAQGKHMINR